MNGAVSRQYTYGLQRISELQTVNNTPTPSFYQYDGRGTVRMLTNSAGQVTDTYEYDAFGNLLDQTGTTPNVYLYRGEQWDPDLSLYYLRARYYNPVTGRFMTQDPYGGEIHNPASLHRYRYASGNPVNFIDPSGRENITDYALITADITAIAALEVGTVGLAVKCWIGTEGSILQVLNAGESNLETLVGLRIDQAECAAQAAFAIAGLGEFDALLPEAEPLELEPPGICCFAAGTPVHTKRGRVPVEKIKAGDLVLSRNRANGKLEYERVSKLTPPHRDKLLEMRIEGELQSLRPSLDHPFLVKRSTSDSGHWIEASNMKVGDLVETIDGKWHKVLSINAIADEQTVYNFEVDKDHDYFVGAAGILVHNAICWITPGSLPAEEEEAVADTLEHIENGTTPPGAQGKNWGTPFQNKALDLPGGNYSGDPANSPFQEYRVAPPPGTTGAGARRIVVDNGTGQTYYTWTHYGTAGEPPFVIIR